MVHNGIEYGMMQAYGEGFEILEASEYGDYFNYAEKTLNFPIFRVMSRIQERVVGRFSKQWKPGCLPKSLHYPYCADFVPARTTPLPTESWQPCAVSLADTPLFPRKNEVFRRSAITG
jgi:hypothetical protein